MDSLLDNLTPEQLAALLQGSTLQDEGTLLQQQLAELLGPVEHRQYSTPIGAGLGGIAEALDGTANAFHAKALRGDQRKNLEAQAKLKGDFGALLRGPQVPPMANQPADPTAITPQWGLDLSAAPAATSQTEITPEWGLDLTPRNQPADPTQIVDDGSDGWGIDLSDPKHVAAILRGSKPAITPQVDVSASPEVAMSQLPARKDRKRAFAF